MPTLRILPQNEIRTVEPGANLQQVLVREGFLLDAPCGGQGTCGKCKVWAQGREVLACRTEVAGDMTVTLPEPGRGSGTTAVRAAAAAFDIGTTTLVCFLLDSAGRVVAQGTLRNPQVSFGADVVSRIRAAMAGHRASLTGLIRKAMTALLEQLCAAPEELETLCVVGNPAMQQLFLGLEVDNLARIPFEPVLTRWEIRPAKNYLPVCSRAELLLVPDISGFVGADTVACVLSTGLHRAREMTLLVDIGTNGELVLGNRDRMIACATAAGPALEGANIHFGMCAAPGAIDHVRIEKGELRCSALGDEQPRGICGSGLIDAVAAGLNLGLINERGRIMNPERTVSLTDEIYLTQEDIRQLQLAKGAIHAGISLLTREMGIHLEDISRVLLAGAFGSCLNPASACRIGLLPTELLGKITAVGNAAGAGAVCLAADPEEGHRAEEIARKAEFLELAGLQEFPKAFARAMLFREDWYNAARALGFAKAYPLDPARLQAREDVRAMCGADKCRAYGKNWTCPPECGSLEQCQKKMRGYKRGILVQTVGQLLKDIDSRGYRETEKRHLEQFSVLCDAMHRLHPEALCLGTGGCRICGKCAWPEPCRHPDRAVSSMEGYGLFVTQVCRDCGAQYHHGLRTVTYTSCILY